MWRVRNRILFQDSFAELRIRDGEEQVWCKECKKWSTEDHQAGEEHRRKLQWLRHYQQQELELRERNAIEQFNLRQLDRFSTAGQGDQEHLQLRQQHQQAVYYARRGGVQWQPKGKGDVQQLKGKGDVPAENSELGYKSQNRDELIPYMGALMGS